MWQAAWRHGKSDETLSYDQQADSVIHAPCVLKGHQQVEVDLGRKWSFHMTVAADLLPPSAAMTVGITFCFSASVPVNVSAVCLPHRACRPELCNRGEGRRPGSQAADQLSHLEMTPERPSLARHTSREPR